MTYHDFYLPLVIGMIGLLAGIYLLSKVKKLPNDRILIFDFIMMGLVQIYVGTVYILFLMNIVEINGLSMLIRPSIIFQLGLPAVITWRMGVTR